MIMQKPFNKRFINTLAAKPCWRSVTMHDQISVHFGSPIAGFSVFPDIVV